MRVKLDENMPGRAGALLIAQGHDVATVAAEGLGGKSDVAVARTAARERRMVVTLDRRFADIRRYPPGHHPGFLVLRPQNQSSSAVERLLTSFLDQYRLDDMVGCIVVVEASAVRIRRPG